MLGRSLRREDRPSPKWPPLGFPTLATSLLLDTEAEVPSFNSSEAMGLQLASRLIPTHSPEEIFKYFFGLEGLSDDKFLIYRRQTYPSSIILLTSTWEEAKEADL